MTKQELLEKLKVLAHVDDFEYGHGEADDLLIQYINDPEIKQAYEEVGKWYA